MSGWYVKIGGESGDLLEKVQVEYIEWGYAFPRRCQLVFPGRHDLGLPTLTNNNEIWISRESDFSTLMFRGFLEVNNPQGVTSEGIAYTAYGLEHAANRFIVKYNKSVDRTYNVESLPDYTSPNVNGERWTVGQIMIDVLEHALGIPTRYDDLGGGFYELIGVISDIPLHHPTPNSVTDPYMPSNILRPMDNPGYFTYDPDSILALDLELPEVHVTTQRFWDFMQMMVQKMDHHGIFIDPSNPDAPFFTVHDYTASTVVDFNFGEYDQHIEDIETAPGAPLVTESSLTFSITECRTRIIVEGRGLVQELIPLGVGGPDDGTMVPHWDPNAEPNDPSIGREWIIRDGQKYTPFWEGPISLGLGVIGPILVINGVPCHPDFANWDLEIGAVSVDQDLRWATTIEAWTLYLAPFQVIAGPGGSAYDDHGLISEEAIFDDSLVHPSHPLCLQYGLISTYNYGPLYDCIYGNTSSSNSGEEYCLPLPPRNDTALMQGIADAMLARMGDEKVSVDLTLDAIDLTQYNLTKKGNLIGLAKWDTLEAQVIQIRVTPQTDSMSVKLTNDVFRVPNYAEFKRRAQLRDDVNILKTRVNKIKRLTQIGGSTSFSR